MNCIILWTWKLHVIWDDFSNTVWGKELLNKIEDELIDSIYSLEAIEESLSLNSDLEVIEISNNYYKIKINEISDTKTITYKAKVKENITENELESTVEVTMSNSDETILENNKIYIPRVEISKNLENN